MNAFKRKSVYAAVAASLGAVALQAGAVNIGTDNTGQVLLYPYYTVRGGYVTSFTVVNTTGNTKVAKVRFLEGKNSAEVLDFNLWLSPFDVWAGQIAANASGAVLTTSDKSCTAPAIPSAGQAFTNLYYTGQSDQGAGTQDDGPSSLDRTREGYIEVIEMGVTDTVTAPGPAFATAVKHANTGIPANCAVVRFDGLASGNTGITVPTGGLAGNGIIIDVASGTEFAYVPTALANFTATPLYRDPGDINPSLLNANPLTSVSFANGTITAITANWPAGTGTPDAVSAVLMHASVINEYEVSSSISGKTDWVVTMPTKRYYVFDAAPTTTNVAAGSAVSPFTSEFVGAGAADNDGTAKACETFYIQVYDREEAPYGAAPGIVFSPRPTGSGPNTGSLCWESTVVTFVPDGGAADTASVFKSTNTGTLPLPAGTTAPNYSSGWAKLTFIGDNSALSHAGQQLLAGAITVLPSAAGVGLVSMTAQSFKGLPIIGFAAEKASAGAAGGLGGLFAHKYTTLQN